MTAVVRNNDLLSHFLCILLRLSIRIIYLDDEALFSHEYKIHYKPVVPSKFCAKVLSFDFSVQASGVYRVTGAKLPKLGSTYLLFKKINIVDALAGGRIKISTPPLPVS